MQFITNSSYNIYHARKKNMTEHNLNTNETDIAAPEILNYVINI